MEKLRKCIREYGNVKQFLEVVGISRSFFCEWEGGKKRISLQIASRIVKYTKNTISYDDLVKFEKSFEDND